MILISPLEQNWLLVHVFIAYLAIIIVTKRVSICTGFMGHWSVTLIFLSFLLPL